MKMKKSAMSEKEKAEKAEHEKKGEYYQAASYAECIDESALNFREIGTTDNTEFVDRTVRVALRSSAPGEMAMGETQRGPGARADVRNQENVFLYAIASIDDQGNESKKSEIALISFDEKKWQGEKQWQKDKEKEEKQKKY